ncbi:MAG: preprotein translocase subunit SecG [Minisyncoccia bacterium]|jgi:protein translocase SecG subunit
MLIWGQIVISMILIGLILIQERSSGLSGVFGGQGATPYQTRRGIEKFVYWGTIGAAIIFVVLAILNLIQ